MQDARTLLLLLLLLLSLPLPLLLLCQPVALFSSLPRTLCTVHSLKYAQLWAAGEQLFRLLLTSMSGRPGGREVNLGSRAGVEGSVWIIHRLNLQYVCAQSKSFRGVSGWGWRTEAWAHHIVLLIKCYTITVTSTRVGNKLCNSWGCQQEKEHKVKINKAWLKLVTACFSKPYCNCF